MTKLVNRAKMTTATTGTGTITLGSAVDGYQTFAAAGVADADVVRYVIEDGDAWEIGLGTYTASGTTLTRGSIESSNADNPLNLTGNAVVFVSAAAADLQELVDFADNFVLPTADGSTGQVLTTNGAGTLSFTTITGGATDINGLSDGYSDGSSVGLGSGALANDDGTANQNTAVGVNALNATTSGFGNTALGFNALTNTTTGLVNTAIGYTVLSANTTGNANIALGNFNLQSNTTGGGNFAAGNQTLNQNTVGGFNVGIGRAALRENVAGSEGIAIGTDSQRYINDTTTPWTNTNVSVGYQSLFGSTTASNNTGLNNIAIGYQALQINESGSDNVALGYQAGDATTTGSNQIIIGSGADASSATVSNEITLGNSSITNLRVPGVGFQFDTTDGLIVPKTITAGGTTGAQTINKTAGSVNFAAAATSLVVTNSFVDANSVIIATVATNDTTMTSVKAVAAAGSFTLYANAAATAETRVNWFVAN